MNNLLEHARTRSSAKNIKIQINSPTLAVSTPKLFLGKGLHLSDVKDILNNSLLPFPIPLDDTKMV